MIPKYWIYQVWDNSGNYLGVLQGVKNEFVLNLDINSIGPYPVEIQVAQSADTAPLSVKAIITEDGKVITTEDGKWLTTEGEPTNYGVSGTKVRNGNIVKITEVSSFHPTGLLVFTGRIKKWNVNYGTDDLMTLYATPLSHDLNNHLVRSDEIEYYAQTASNDGMDVFDFGGFPFAQIGYFIGTTTDGIDNISSITLRGKIANALAPVPVTLRIFAPNDLNELSNTANELASSTVTMTNTSDEDVKFAFTVPASKSIDRICVFTLETPAGTIFGNHATFRYQRTDVVISGHIIGYYNDGTGYRWQLVMAESYADFYYRVDYIPPYTKSVITGFDPSTLLKTFINNYLSEGGVVNYLPGDIDMTGEVVSSYTFSVNTVKEGLDIMLDFSPKDWYYTIDPGINEITFKHSNVTEPDHVFTFKQHISSLDLSASTENLKNHVYITGGDIGGGVNLFKEDQNETSIAAFGEELDRISDIRVTDSDTGIAKVARYLDRNDDEVFETKVTIIDGVVDVTQYKPGQTVGFAGFNSLADTVILPIVRLSRHGSYVDLYLGVLPFRESTQINDTQDKLLSIQTIDNPNQPS